MSRKDLRDLAANFRESSGPAPALALAADDVTAQIERRLAEARGPGRVEADPVTPGDADLPVEMDIAVVVETPAAITRSTPSGSAPTLRDTEPRQRVPVDMPSLFEPMRQRAKGRGITATTLVLTALRAHGPAMAARARREGIAPVTGTGFKRWTLLMSDDELQELDDLTEALAPALGRRSRAKTIALALDAHEH